MSCLCASYYTPEARHSRDLDKELYLESLRALRQVKILLLGAGETGKSTFAKQMRIIYGEDYDKKDLLEFRNVIYTNVFKAIKVLCDAREKLRIPWGNQSFNAKAQELLQWKIPHRVEQRLFIENVEMMSKLWNDRGIQTAYSRKREFQLPDSTEYFMERLSVIKAEDYLPTKEDVLRSRKISRGITEYHTEVSHTPFVFVDVGGQRHYRQKWVLCFENVTSILFFVSASEYDEVLAEDRQTNRMKESLDLFGDIVNSATFARTHVILFFNKTDQLRVKIHQSNIKRYFPSFKGDPREETDVKRFLYMMFDTKRLDHSKSLFYHFTTAIDTNNIRFVFEACKQIILQSNLDRILL